MISQLSDNPIGRALAGVCAGLLAVLLLLAVIWAAAAIRRRWRRR